MAKRMKPTRTMTATERDAILLTALREARATFRKFSWWRPISAEAHEERQQQLALSADRLDRVLTEVDRG